MMATTPPDGAYRYAKWAARFQRDSEGNLPQGSTPMMERMLAKPEFAARVQQSFDDMYAMEGEVRQVLNSDGISMIQYPYYLAFGRQLWKLTQRVSGESAAIEAQTIIAKWVARGLDQTVLEKIRTDVFGILAPTP